MARGRRARHNRRVDLPVNVVDLSIVAIVVIAAFLGWQSGALPQFLGLVGAAAGIGAVVLLVPSCQRRPRAVRSP